eukprot:4370520-Prymnesium_polylepis.2
MQRVKPILCAEAKRCLGVERPAMAARPHRVEESAVRCAQLGAVGVGRKRLGDWCCGHRPPLAVIALAERVSRLIAV